MSTSMKFSSLPGQLATLGLRLVGLGVSCASATSKGVEVERGSASVEREVREVKG